jgi:hypothetical protein
VVCATPVQASGIFAPTAWRRGFADEIHRRPSRLPLGADGTRKHGYHRVNAWGETTLRFPGGHREYEVRVMSNETLINREFITRRMTTDDPWCSSHGSASGSEDLGAGMIYYALAYSLKARVCVCLGSGGGFVPRLMRQAQRDLNLVASRTILVDGSDQVDPAKKKIWGSPDWTSHDSAFRTNFPDIEIVLELTENAFDGFFRVQGMSIDFLHIDADHHYEGVRRDWDLYSTLLSGRGVVTLHDTVNFREPCGVPRLLEEIRDQGEYEIINFPISYGTAILKKRQDNGRK